MKSTEPIGYIYRLTEDIEIILVRRHRRTAYARNGNTHNPTQYFAWDAYQLHKSTINDESISHVATLIVSSSHTRREAYVNAKSVLIGLVKDISWPKIEKEMVRNYRTVRKGNDLIDSTSRG